METSDGLEASENEDCSVRTLDSEHTINVQSDIKASLPKPTPINTPAVATSGSKPGKLTPVEKEEVKPDDNLEWASQQSTETGSWDGSGRDVLNSSMTSTTSTLVPEMLEEDDDEEEDDEYHQEPISVSRIESWVSETQRTMETLQLVNSPEEDNIEQSEDDDVVEPSEHVDPVVECKERTVEKLPRNGSNPQSGGRAL